MRPIEKFRESSVLPPVGSPVRINQHISDKELCEGFLVKQKYLDARRPSEDGIYEGYVPGAGGDVWWIRHKDDTIGAYMFTEITDREIDEEND